MLWLLLIFMPLVAEAQSWNTHVVMTDLDSSNNGCAQAVLDADYRLHVFYLRNWQRPPYEVGLYYQRFDNWGNILSEPLELPVPGAPDSCRYRDYCAGAFIDRNQNIHVVWSRTYGYWPCSDSDPQMLYARLNTQGEIVTGPLRLTTPEQNYFTYGGINMVQDCTGVIWATEGAHYWAFSEVGEVLIPTSQIVEPPRYAAVAILSRDPQDRVWALYTQYLLAGRQNISAIRIDTVGAEPEVISPNDGPNEIFAMSPHAYLIDAAGVFHCVLSREDCGLFYQRDPRNGEEVDTLVIDSIYYGQQSTRFCQVGSDTLLFLWYNALQPSEGFDLDGFHLAGGWAWGPEHVAHDNFDWGLGNRILWHNGSYWFVGQSNVNGHGQLSMIHVPGPNEPANAVRDTPRNAPGVTPIIILYPQPVRDILQFALPAGIRGPSQMVIYNVLGQQVFSCRLKSGERIGVLSMPLYISAGTYFLEINTAVQTFHVQFVYVP